MAAFPAVMRYNCRRVRPSFDLYNHQREIDFEMQANASLLTYFHALANWLRRSGLLTASLPNQHGRLAVGLFWRVGGVIACMVCAPALAQSSGQTLADVAQSQSVGGRSKTNYDPTGISLGAAQMVLSVDGKVLYDDNVYNTSAPRLGDVEAVLEPHAQLKLDTGRYMAVVDADASVQRFAKLTAENSIQYDLNAHGRMEFGQGVSFDAAGFVGRHSELRGTLGDVVVGAPSQFDRRGGTANLAIQLGSIAFDAGGGAEDLSYLPVTFAGQTTSQDYRSRMIYTLHAGANRAVSPGMKIFVRGDYNAQDYDQIFQSADQNSRGYAAVAGLEFGVTGLISGQLNVGYLSQKYTDTALGTVAGATYGGTITWNPTSLITATATGGRTLQQSPFFAEGGVLEDNLALRIDYEFLRNFIISASEQRTNDNYRGIDRHDLRYTSNLSSRYLINRGLELGLQLGHRDQASQGVLARNYVGNSVMIDLVVKR